MTDYKLSKNCERREKLAPKQKIYVVRRVMPQRPWTQFDVM
jgi:hypothetical protein